MIVWDNHIRRAILVVAGLAVIVALLGFAHNNRDLPRPAVSPASPVQEQRPNAVSADPQVYETILVALGKPGPAWAHWLDKLESDLIATGTSPSDARTAILTVIRDTRVPDGWAIEMVRVSRDIGAVMGTGIVSETRLLTQAVATGYEGYRQYSLTRGLDAGDVKLFGICFLWAMAAEPWTAAAPDFWTAG